MKNKVAFIGPEAIHAALSVIDDNLDFQKPVTSLSELQTELEKDNRQLISEDTSVIIFFSRLFKGEDQDNFTTLAAFMAPYSAVCILHPDSDGDDVKELIQYSLREQLELYAKTDKTYNPNIPFYFISYEDPQADLSKALALYVKDPYANDEARANILKSLPDHVARQLENENERIEEQIQYEIQEDEDLIPDRDPTSRGRIIAITSSKGGSGKSTASMLLGAYIAKGSKLAVSQGTETKPLKVCIVDLDVRDGQLGFLNGVTSPTVVDILAAGELIPTNISKGIYHSKKMECDFVFAAKRPRYTTAIPPEFYANLIEQLRGMYDYVILDTSVNYLDPLLEKVAYPMADKILFVTDLSISSIYGMARWLMETTRVEDNKNAIDQEKIGVILNKVLRNVNMELDKIQTAASGRPIVGMYPSVPGLITYAANTCSIEQVLNHRTMNEMAFKIAKSIVEPTGYTLSELPSRD